MCKLLNEKQAAEFLNLSVKTLQRWRQVGGGSRYIKLGRAVRYSEDDLRAFADAGTRRHTSEAVANT